MNFDFRNDIVVERYDSLEYSPHYLYSIENGFNPKEYNVCGFQANVCYNSREHQNRSFGGIYAEMSLRYNTKILGSTEDAWQLYTEFRKYWSLSYTNPEHVLALWYWGSYLMGGKLPYLELPATEYDMYNRGGRGYTLGRFRGPHFADFEAEYRFPISQRTKLFSGVLFGSLQSGSDGKNINIFHYFEPAGGAGLRLLFNKRARTNLCMDYAFGRYGSSGFFLALNEAF
jgi:outer membrane protein assembly factor BamA